MVEEVGVLVEDVSGGLPTGLLGQGEVALGEALVGRQPGIVVELGRVRIIPGILGILGKDQHQATPSPLTL